MDRVDFGRKSGDNDSARNEGGRKEGEREMGSTREKENYRRLRGKWYL